MKNRFRSEHLQSSILWVGISAALVSSLVVGLIVGTPAMRLKNGIVITLFPGLGTAAIPAAILSSVLFWWLLIVYPKRVTIVRGILVGIVSVIGALCLMWPLYWLYATVMLHIPMRFPSLLMVGNWVLVICRTLKGWIYLMIGGSVGGLLAWYVHRIALLRVDSNQGTQEALQQQMF